MVMTGENSALLIALCNKSFLDHHQMDLRIGKNTTFLYHSGDIVLLTVKVKLLFSCIKKQKGRCQNQTQGQDEKTCILLYCSDDDDDFNENEIIDDELEEELGDDEDDHEPMDSQNVDANQNGACEMKPQHVII